MAKGSIGVTTSNIFPVIKQFLYSDHEIFLREIVSNAVDATQKLKTLANAGEFKGKTDDLKVSVKLDTEAGTLTVSDNGIGMTAEEIDKYINQIAFSGAEDFLNKFKDNANAIIGHFGLGFYSAFMVSKKVEIHTLSYKEGAKAMKWTCDGSPEYDMEECEKAERGTDIVMYIDDEEKEYLEKNRISALLNKYCRFMPVPVIFGKEQEWKDGKYVDTDTDKVINNIEPLWTRTPTELKDEDYIKFYHAIQPGQEDPLFWIHLNVDFPFTLTGILYFPKIKNNLDVRKDRIQLYCNQVFVTDSVEGVVPDFMMLLQGVIDSPDIPLNVSRSYLQADRGLWGFVCALLISLFFLSACSSTKFVGEDEYLLADAKVKTEDKTVKASSLKGVLRQKPNSRWFNLYKAPLHIYSLSRRDTTRHRRWNRMLRRLGEAPVIYDSVQTELSVRALEQALQSKGYLHARATSTTEVTGKKKKRVTYTLLPGPRHYIDSLSYEFDNAEIERIVRADSQAFKLHRGLPLDLSLLSAERDRIISLLGEKGRYGLHKEYISYRADTLTGSTGAVLTLRFKKPAGTDERAYKERHFSNVNIYEGNEEDEDEAVYYRGLTFHLGRRKTMNKRVYFNHILPARDSLYKETMIQGTNAGARLRPTTSEWRQCSALAFAACALFFPQMFGKKEIIP